MNVWIVAAMMLVRFLNGVTIEKQVAEEIKKSHLGSGFVQDDWAKQLSRCLVTENTLLFKKANQDQTHAELIKKLKAKVASVAEREGILVQNRKWSIETQTKTMTAEGEKIERTFKDYCERKERVDGVIHNVARGVSP